jgi:hypothetical protein
MVVLIIDGASGMGAALQDLEAESRDDTYPERGDQSG